MADLPYGSTFRRIAKSESGSPACEAGTTTWRRELCFISLRYFLQRG